MNFYQNQNNNINAMMNALRETKTTEPDEVESELIEGAVDRDGSTDEAYADYVREEMNAIRSRQNN